MEPTESMERTERGRESGQLCWRVGEEVGQCRKKDSARSGRGIETVPWGRKWNSVGSGEGSGTVWEVGKEVEQWRKWDSARRTRRGGRGSGGAKEEKVVQIIIIFLIKFKKLSAIILIQINLRTLLKCKCSYPLKKVMSYFTTYSKHEVVNICMSPHQT